MNNMQKLNRYFSDLGGNRFLDTESALVVRDNFYTNKTADTVFLHPQDYMLQAVYDHFSKLKATMNPDRLRELELTATYENGKLIDLHSIYTNLQRTASLRNSHQGLLNEKDALPLLETFGNIVAPCIQGDHVIKLYGGRIEDAKDWHTDDSNYGADTPEVVGILPLDKPHLTTRFPGILGDIKAPENTICFVGKSAKHKDAGEERPTLQIFTL